MYAGRINVNSEAELNCFWGDTVGLGYKLGRARSRRFCRDIVLVQVVITRASEKVISKVI